MKSFHGSLVRETEDAVLDADVVVGEGLCLLFVAGAEPHNKVVLATAGQRCHGFAGHGATAKGSSLPIVREGALVVPVQDNSAAFTSGDFWTPGTGGIRKAVLGDFAMGMVRGNTSGGVGELVLAEITFHGIGTMS